MTKRYKVSVKVETCSGLNIGHYLGCVCEALVDATFTDPTKADGQVQVHVVDMRLRDQISRALPLPQAVSVFIGSHESLIYKERAINILDSVDGVKGQAVIKLSDDLTSLHGLAVFSAGFWEQRLMAGLHLRIDGQEVSGVQR